MCVGRIHTKIHLGFIMFIETEITSRETKNRKKTHWKEEIMLPFRPWRIKRRERFQDCEILQLCRPLVGIDNICQP